MKFRLLGNVIFSDKASEAEKTIEETIKDANGELLKRGAPEGKKDEAAEVTDWKIDGNKLQLKIESGRYVRAHDAILRLKKSLARNVGEKHRLGVRNIEIGEYQISIPLEEKVLGKPKLPEVDVVDVRENELVLIFRDLTEKELQTHVVDRVVKMATDLIEREETLAAKVTKITPGTIIDEGSSKKIAFDRDPAQEAERLGWIKRFPVRGQWIYLPPYATLLRTITNLLIEDVALKLGFQESLFPKLIPLNIMFKMKYLEGLPEGMYYVTPPKREPELFEEFKREMIVKNKIPVEKLQKGLREPQYVLAPAQCEPFYQFLSGEIFTKEKLPYKLFDASGWTYRWEGGAAKGLERVQEFQRVELVWIGTPEQTDKIRDDTLEATKNVVDEKLDLEWKVRVSDDPFYLEGRMKEDRDIKFPEIPSLNLDTYLPYKGSREDGEAWMSIASFNVHGEHFIEGFSVKEARKEAIFTGCTGLGISRWVAAFLAQHGFSFENWPKPIKTIIKTLPKVPESLEWPPIKKEGK